MTLTRPNVPTRGESLLPPHERKSVIQVPVTPGVTKGTYEKDYFERLGQVSPGVTPGDTPHGACRVISKQLGLSKKIISATFTIPHQLEYQHDASWTLHRRYHRSALLDSLNYLSIDSAWEHTVVAWTGEIHHAPEYDTDSKRNILPLVVPSSTSMSGGVHSNASQAKPTLDAINLSRESQIRLEHQLYEDVLRIVPVWLADDADVTEDEIKLHDQSRWRRYAEHDLCALFHYKQHRPTDGCKDDGRWTDYCRMNQMFADKICEVYEPGDIIMVHDYHLMLLPEMLRQRHPDICVTFFLHTPFPSSELVRCLARRNNILEGVLGSNLIAMQSFHYAQHLANACSRILGLEGTSSKCIHTPTRQIHLEVIPVGISVSNICSKAFTASVDKKCQALRNLHEGRKIIVAYDPIDRLGGVDKKLAAFERFLNRYPEWQGRVVLIQVLNQTINRDDDAEEAQYASNINSLVTSINTNYGSLDYAPIQLHAQNLATDEYFALLRSGDVALFTSIRDGMSTTSMEYVVCQQKLHGSVIISEFSGTAGNLEEAIHINPWDTVGVADQIYETLNMTAKQRQRMHTALYKRICDHDVGYWVKNILRRLMDCMRFP